VLVASDGQEAARILHAPDAPKLAVLDWMMPGLDGVQLCREIRRQKQEPYTYILLLTAKGAQRDIIEGLDAGADDYVTKPFDSGELKVRLRTGKRILHLQDQLIAAREALRELATHDPLTGLWNRAAIIDILKGEIARSKRQEAPVGLIMADLDHFKDINDRYGHLVGDAMLSKVSHAIRNATRPYDAVARYGGEEFLIVLPGCNPMNAVSHAERLRAIVSGVRLETSLGPISMTASFGVAVYEGGDNLDPFDLIRASDMTLYRAKRAGRNRVETALNSDFAPVTDSNGHANCMAETT
jgi:diguanylate cyclase (GGDEF)-like protein